MSGKNSFLFRNGLSLAFLLLFVLSLAGQIYTGWKEHDDFLADYGQPGTSLGEYIVSGHFLQATFENWESEFFQMALFVVLTIYLRQEGSSESKACDDPLFDHDNLIPREDSPEPVKRGGLQLAIYKNSLSVALIFLFVLSFVLHWYGSWLDHNEQQMLEHEPLESFGDFVSSKKLWFESFQNWQSEFLSIFAIVFLSIYLRQFGSSQSKPVNASHRKKGEA